MNFKKYLFVALVLFQVMSCKEAGEKHNFKSGDILFRGNGHTELSKAIDEVTQTGSKHHYTHMGVVEVSNDTVWVIHAAPEKGVCKETLGQFCMTVNGSALTSHYRIKNIKPEQIEQAIKQANTYLGQAYNYSYIISDKGFYCSEFIYELYATDSVFQLEPMTFINPATGHFHEGWVKHYNKIGIEIPEGEPGCNPNGMAASERLEFLQHLNK